jgi:hypothetical protein
MDIKDLKGLMEAYQQIHSPEEEIEEGMTIKDFKQQRSRQKQKEKRAALKTSPTRRAGIHNPSASPERAARHRANVDPDYDHDDEEKMYPGGKLKNPKKIRKAKALGELGEQTDIFDVVLEFLQAEGLAETLEEAEWMMANMIDEEAIEIVVGEGYQRNPEKGEKEDKKYAPVRGEKTPMPPRGDKRREDFEKWYAKQMGR